MVKSFVYAWRGLVKTWHEEQNLQIHTFAAFAAVLAGYFLAIDPTEWLILVIAIMMVLLMEIINSAVERVTDILKPRIHSYVKEIKDIMAAAVLLASIGALIIGGLIFIPRIWALFSL